MLRLVLVFVFLLVCTVVIYSWSESVGRTMYAVRSPRLSKLQRAELPKTNSISLNAARSSSTQVQNESIVTRTTVALLTRTNGRQLQPDLWTAMGCRSPQPLLACTLSEKNKRPPDFKIATRDVFYNNRVLHARSDSCSLVGAAGWLLNRSYGEDIDSHQLVVRVNSAPIKGYERYVVRRPADIVMMQKGVKVCPPDLSNATLIVRFYRDINRKDQSKECMKKYSSPIYAVGPAPYSVGGAVLHAYRRVVTVYNTTVFRRVARPTAGLMATIFCLQLCKELHIYGFGWKPGELYAYYRNLTYFTTAHNYEMESKFLEDLSTGEYRNVLKTELPLQGKWKVYLHR